MTSPTILGEAREWFCCARSNHGYVCSREVGHLGAHVASTIDDVVDTWPQAAEVTS